jgi:beta-lactamase class A
MKNLFSIFLLIHFCIFPAFSQQELPMHMADAKIKSLEDSMNKDLQKGLEKELLSNPLWSKLIKQKKMAVGVVDLSNPNQVKYARVNGNYMMYAASLPKIAILLTVMDAIEKGEIKETEDIKKDMRLMISKSDNQASTRLIDLVGYKRIEGVMTNPRYQFYNKKFGGGLWVGKRYGKGGKTNREPLKNLSHAASVNQVCKYYYMLAYGKLVNEKRSKEMLDIFEHPELHHKFVNTLDRIAPDARLFRKSGSWETYHSDSVLVWGDPSRRYILVALIDDPNGEQIIRNLVVPVEKILKKQQYLTAN